MALIVENGTGLANAESFVTVLEIEDYATRFGLTFLGTTTEKEIKARKGTRYLEAKYGRSISGYRAVIGQALSWPRSNATDSEAEVYYDGLGSSGVYIPNNVVPQPWKDAASEMSILSGAEDILPDVANSGLVTSKSVQVGPISKSTTWASGNSPLKWYRKVDLLIRRYLTSSDEVVRA